MINAQKTYYHIQYVVCTGGSGFCCILCRHIVGVVGTTLQHSTFQCLIECISVSNVERQQQIYQP